MLGIINKNILAVSIVVIGLVVAGAIIGASFFLNQGKESLPEETSGPQELAEKTVSFINESLLTDGSEASLIGVEDEGIVYRIRLEIGGAEYESYVSKDGKFLFPQGYILNEETQIEASEEQEEETLEKEFSALKLEELAKCLTESGAKFYGAYWCSWCNQQKELFGEASQYLPYVECSNEETQEMTQICQEDGISSFPTWEFNGVKESGFKEIQQLSELSGCSI